MIYSEEFEKLISVALLDGVLTEQEKRVLFKKAESLGIDLDELDMELQVRLFEQKGKNTSKEAKASKCPKCGATDITFNVNTVLLRCNFCRHEFEPEKGDDAETDLSKLEGVVIGSGAHAIIADENEVLTLQCSSCGSEVVIDTASAYQARCHWCRNTLSVNQAIPNGAVPDMVLPFLIKKEEAIRQLKKIFKGRKFYAHPKFKKEFCPENVMGVYLPYMVVDINAHANFAGQGEIETRRYSSKKNTYYEADVYDVEREFDIVVEGLTVEASADKLNLKDSKKATNIINSIMPFDTENCVKWNANYLKGFTSEKRDTNVFQLSSLVQVQAKDVTRYKANDSLTRYDRGVEWSKQDFDIKGKRWKAAYLPVWLYSYFHKDKNMLHYLIVNARTKETAGSIPINKVRLAVFTAIISLSAVILCLSPFIFFIDFFVLILLSPFLLFGAPMVAYIHWKSHISMFRNKGERHYHETETKSTIDNLRQSDVFVAERKVSNDKIKGVNNKRIDALFLQNINFDKKLVDAYGWPKNYDGGWVSKHYLAESQ